MAELAQAFIVAAKVAESHVEAQQEAAAAEDQTAPEGHAELEDEKPEEPFQEQEGHEAPEFDLPQEPNESHEEFDPEIPEEQSITVSSDDEPLEDREPCQECQGASVSGMCVSLCRTSCQQTR